MKRFISLLLSLFILPIMNLSIRIRPPKPEFHPLCEMVNRTQPLNYLGINLTINSDDPQNLLLCPGDAIGDLNETYVKIQDCNLTMYHKDQIIWSKKGRDSLFSRGQCSNNDYCMCIFYLERDGHLVLDQEEIELPWFGPILFRMDTGESEYFGPIKSELRLKDQQLQIIRIFSDGTQRLFYLDANHKGFTEDMGEPIKVADKLIIKSHKDQDKTILRRNEYVGDLNGRHMILKINCDLQLRNKNHIIWSLSPDFAGSIPCTLDIAQDNTIEISRRWMNKTLPGRHNQQSIMESEANLEVVESRITFESDEPIITQTLKNGSELTFYGGRLNRTLKQISQQTLIAQRSSNQGISRMERMEYLGNLTGLHLILEQNCSLILNNGNEKLWEFKGDPRNTAAIGCSVQLESHGQIRLNKYPRYSQRMLEYSHSAEYTELTLQNNQIVVNKYPKDRDQPDIFYAGPQTNGTFFQFIAQNSITIANHNHYYTEILPKMGYIGDLNGIYVLLDKNCNLVLYNKTQIVWESGISLDQTCSLGLHDDWEVKISAGRETLWSAFDVPPHVNFGQLLKAELSILHNELWLIYTFRDGTVNREKAMKGTNRFTNNLAHSLPPFHSDWDKMMLCRERNGNQTLNYVGANLTSNSNDPKDIVLCPGDAFGDLNETYVVVKNCYLALYHKNKTIWTSKVNPSDRSEEYACAFSIKRNGNLVLYKESVAYLPSGPPIASIFWHAQTNMNSFKTDLRIQDQQVQILHTLRNGTQKLFYADANHQEFIEDMGEPVKVADKFILKDHSNEDKTILRRNEYIGDLNGTHLILQTNCDLLLLNKNKTLWSFVPPFWHFMNCTVNVAKDNTIGIYSLLTDNQESIMKHKKSLEAVKSKITFEGDQPRIIQTLKDGSELIFCGAGLNTGLSIKRDLKQIAQKTIVVQIDEDSDTDSDFDTDSDSNSDSEDDISVIKRMDYIGNLTGLHLILEQNCSLILANGHQKLWELQSEPAKSPNPVMECSVRLPPSGEIRLERPWIPLLLDHSLYPWKCPEPIGVELTLENDQVIIKKEFKDRGPKFYHAGAKTDGMFFQFIGESSVIANFDDDDYWNDQNEILPKMGYIGDLNGVYAMLDKNCNLVLFNKTQVLWESGNSQEDAWNSCSLYLIRNQGNVEILVKRPSDRRKMTWSALGFSKPINFLKQVLGIELSVHDGELWLIDNFSDGTAHEYKAKRGTNLFALVPKKHELFFSGEL